MEEVFGYKYVKSIILLSLRQETASKRSETTAVCPWPLALAAILFLEYIP